MAGVLFTFALIALIDLFPILRRRMWRDFAAFLVIFVPALAIAILLSFNIEVPSSMSLIGKWIEAIGLSY